MTVNSDAEPKTQEVKPSISLMCIESIYALFFCLVVVRWFYCTVTDFVILTLPEVSIPPYFNIRSQLGRLIRQKDGKLFSYSALLIIETGNFE